MIALARSLRDRGVRSRPRDLGAPPGETVIDNSKAGSSFPGLRRCLERVEEPARRAVLRPIATGLSYDELGAVLGMPADAARGLVGRALTRMRQCLDDA